MKLWALTTYFNPEGYQARRRNYCTFRRFLNLPLITIEWSTNGLFQLHAGDADLLVHCSGGDLMWQKERLLGVGLNHLPDDCEAVVIIDADILLADDSWIEDLSLQLHRYPVIQLFREVRHLPPLPDRDLQSLDATLFSAEQIPFYLSRQSFAHRCLHGQVTSPAPTLSLEGYPDSQHEVNRLAARPSFGHAWAFQRDWLERFGLYEYNVAGSGDLAMAMAIANRANEFCHSYPLNSTQQAHYRRWAEPVTQEAGPGKLGALDVVALHLFHGHLSRRSYRSRLEFLSSSNFNPDRDLTAEPGRPFAWNKSSPLINEFKLFFHTYFSNRAEDTEARIPQSSIAPQAHRGDRDPRQIAP